MHLSNDRDIDSYAPGMKGQAANLGFHFGTTSTPNIVHYRGIRFNEENNPRENVASSNEITACAGISLFDLSQMFSIITSYIYYKNQQWELELTNFTSVSEVFLSFHRRRRSCRPVVIQPRPHHSNVPPPFLDPRRHPCGRKWRGMVMARHLGSVDPLIGRRR